ncbi:MAG: NUDIX domain-containing protein [Clostridia bacterium]|nr:NUDIX domain-containing protein [Clostridia bacterium]
MELWDARTRDGKLTGGTLVRGEPIPEGLYHLVCEALVRHADGSFLAMKRDENKEIFPGWWETTAGGSALAGETSLDCVRRELLEETGIAAERFELVARTSGPEYIFDSYLCVVDCAKDAVRFQEGETVDYRWMSEGEFRAFVQSGRMIPLQRDRLLPYLKATGYAG